ncbi:hypothetical protein [Alistipes indistinctus]|uniref:hypothetical protein n=1 Tax=Alistipes indistinctus TaxID=626932 RepID=UPI00266FC159|nr:hypothetical protein [Alistipes indistinctus]
MRKNYAKGVLAGLFGLLAAACGPRGAVEYVPQVGNVNYPEAAVWFARGGFPQSWQGQLDTMLGQLELDLYVLSPRGANLADTAAMNPIYREICRQAAAKGVRIGMHVPAGTNPLPEGVQRQQVIFDGTGRLDADGKGKIRVDGWGIRNGKPVGAKVYKVYSYLSRGEGHYEAGSLRDITDRASVRTPDPAHPELTEVTVDGNSFIGGRPVLAMVAYEYEYPDMFAGMPAYFGTILDRFGDVGLTSAALDEFTYLRTVPPWQIGERQYRGRYYSPAMDSAFRAKYRTDMAGTMLAMRMVPERQEQQRMQAVNRYMDLMREGVVRAQASFYDQAKAKLGKDAWIGWHDTYHNQLGGDELWTTGATWWSTRRDYPMTDEWTPLPTQIGMLYAYPSKVLYNMFYDPNDYILYEKVLTDLRYGIRTGYHAIDDAPVQYGVDFKAPDQIPQVNRLVEAARLLNRFDPGKPDANVLVVFGTEALCNWFPDTAQRTAYDVRKLAIEEKAVELQQAGYLTALVPTDLITDGRLTLSRSNRPVLDGHEFDAMIFLYPEYSRPGTMELMERYMAGGGKLMIEGEMNYDFDGNYVKDRFGAWKKKAVATEFSVEDMPKLGVRRNVLEGASRNNDGSIVLTDYPSLCSGEPVAFSVEVGRDVFSGEYTGMLAFLPERGEVVKLASTGLRSLRKNGKELLVFDAPVKLYGEEGDGGFRLTVVDPDGAKPVPAVNRLF